MIRDCNGRPYKLTGTLQQFDPESREQSLFNIWDAEVIELGGSPIFYYELFLQRQTIDPLFREDRGKIWSDKPIQLFGFYEPISAQNYMNMFGMDAPDEMKFEFNYRAVLKSIGHAPKLGSRLFTPHKREDWVVVERSVGEFKMWGELRLVLMCQRFQEATTTGEGKVTQPKPNFKLNEGNLFK